MKKLSVIQYAKLKGITRSGVYMQILTGAIPKKKIVLETKKVIRILVDEEEN